MRYEGLTPKLREFPKLPKLDPNLARFPNNLPGTMLTFMFGIYSNPGLEEIKQQMFESITNVQYTTKPEKPDPDRIYGLLAYIVLNAYSNALGFGSPGRQEVPTVSKIYPVDRFSELVEQAREWKECDINSTHGVTLGAYDPPHVGHTLDMVALYPYTTRILVGVEPEWSVRERKSKPDDPRPRFPFIMWKMWQFANMKVTDAVFEIPIEKGDDPETFYPHLHKQLGTTLMFTEGDHELLPVYRRQMDTVGGHVMTDSSWRRLVKPIFNIRSTKNMERLFKKYGSKEKAMAIWTERIRKRDAEIRRRYERFMETRVS